MEKRVSEFGNLVTRVMRVDSGSPSRPIAIRLGWTLFWTYHVNHRPLSEDLLTWAKLPRTARQEFPLARDGSVVLHTMAPDQNVIKLEYRTGKNKQSTLELDFGSRTELAASWYSALYCMVTPWQDLLTEAGGVLCEHFFAGARREDLNRVLNAEQREEKLQNLLTRITAAKQHNEQFAKFLESVIKALDVQLDFVKEILGRLPLVGAGFQLLAFGLSCSATVLALETNKRLENDIRKEMACIAGLTIREMLWAIERGSEGSEHLKALSMIMNGLELVMRELDSYVVSHVVRKVLPLDKDFLPNMLKSLSALKQELREVQAAEGVGALLSGQSRSERLIMTIQNSMEERHKQLIERLQNLEEASGEAEKWISGCFTAPNEGQFVVQNTMVRKLREAVLQEPSGRAAAVIGVKGNGGVGKTVACTVVANDPEVRAKFADGVLWMSFGIECTAEKVLQEFLGIVESSGGVRTAEKVKYAWRRSMKDAVMKTAVWFNERKVLIVMDNVWPGKNGDGEIDWITLFTPLAGTAGCLLFSTQSSDIGSTLNPVRVEFSTLSDRDSAIAIFDMHLQLCETDKRYDFDTRNRILQVCAGLPLALATAGRLVRRVQYRWECVINDLEKMLITAKSGADPGGHPGLASTVTVALAKLDKKEIGGSLVELVNLGSSEYSWSEGYYALSVMPRTSPSIPVRMLGLLWNLSEDQALRVTSVYAELGLASISEDDIVRLHDLHWLLCDDKCTMKSSCHERVIKSLPNLSGLIVEPSSSEMHDEQIVDILVSDLPDACEEYLIDNALRHVTMAGRARSSLCRLMLTDYRWIRKKAGRRSVLNVAGDYDLVIRTARRSASVNEATDVGSAASSWSLASDDREGYDTISSTLRKIPYEATPGVHYDPNKAACPVHGDVKPDSGLASQLIGRLSFRCGMTSSLPTAESRLLSAITVTERADVEAQVPSDALGMTKGIRSFWKRISCCFGRNSVDTEEKQPVFERRLGDAKSESVAAASSRSLVVGKLLSSIEKHATGLWLRPLTDHFGCSGGKCARVIHVGDWIMSIAMSLDDKHVYAGCLDGIIREYDIHSGKLMSELRGHRCYVNSVAVALWSASPSQEMVVSGSGDGTVHCWAMPSKDCVGILKKHTGSVECVAASKDGARVVSGSADKTVCVWKSGKGDLWALQARLDHAHPVRHVALSANGQEIVSSSYSWGSGSTIFLWKETTEMVQSSERGAFHCLRKFCDLSDVRGVFPAGGVTFSPEEYDANVMWGSSSGICEWKRDVYEERNVVFKDWQLNCIAVSREQEGQIIAAGSCESVLVGRLDDGELTSMFSGHSGLVRDVVITRDGKQVVSCSRDGTIRVWKMGATHAQDMRAKLSKKTKVRKDESVTAVAASEDGSRVVTVHNYTKIRIWDAKTGFCARDLESKYPLGDIALSQDGKIIVAAHFSFPSSHVVWCDAISGKMQSMKVDFLLREAPFAISRNGCYLALALHVPIAYAHHRADTCEVWDIRTPKLVSTYADIEKPADALTMYVEQKGLGKGAYPSREYSVSSMSPSSSGFIVNVTQSDSFPNEERDSSPDFCSCTASAFLEASVGRVKILPYVGGLDMTGRREKESPGMVAAWCKTDMAAETVEFLEIMTQSE